MPSLDYEVLGGISSVGQTNKVPGSVRSRDRNDKQRLSFKADPNRPFTGIIHVEASVSNPNGGTIEWFPIANMEIDNEGGSWSYEPQGEFSTIRVTCRDGNYWAAAHGAVAGIIGTAGDFTVNGVTVSVNLGDNAATVAATINGTLGLPPGVVADTVNTTALRIYTNDGTDLVLADTVNTPLADMGITSGTFTGGVIETIQMLR